MKKLYLIGNGFDIHHELKTTYKDYKNYLLQQEDSQIVRDFDKFLESKEIDEKSIEDWSQLEEYTKYIYKTDLGKILSDAIKNSEKDIESARYWDEIQFFSKEYSKWITGIKSHVNEWIRNVDYTNVSMNPKLPIDTTATYINFNYTETLELLYGVPDSNVFHIHGKVGSDDLVFGNNCNPDDDIKSSLIPTDNRNEESDWRENQAIDILNSSLEGAKSYYKRSNEIMLKHQALFDSIEECQELIIMGVSFGSEDLCYIKKIAEKGFNIKKITNVYYREKSLEPFREHLCKPLGKNVSVEEKCWNEYKESDK